MPETPNRAGPTQLTAAAAAIATAGAAGTAKKVTTIWLCNTSGASVTVTLGIHTSAADAAARRVLSAMILDPNETKVIDGFLTLLGHATTPDVLYALASVTTVVNVYLDIVDIA